MNLRVSSTMFSSPGGQKCTYKI